MIKLGERYGWICGHSSVCHSLKTQYLGQHQWDFTDAFFCHFQKFYRLAQKKCIITRYCLRWSLLSVSLCPSSPAATRGNTLSAPCHIYRSASFAGRRVFCCLCLFLCAFFFSHRPAALSVSSRRFVLPVSHRLTIIVSRNTNKQQLAQNCCMMTVIHHLPASSCPSAANTPLKLCAAAWNVCRATLTTFYLVQCWCYSSEVPRSGVWVCSLLSRAGALINQLDN